MLATEMHPRRLLSTILETSVMQTQSLSLSQSQQLQMVLAPQLRQSLEMLQLPILELRALIQQEIEQNPTIEQSAPNDAQIEIEPAPEGIDDKKELEFDKEFEMLARLDDDWRDYFYQNLQNRPYSSDDAEKRQFLMDSLPQQESLQEHLVSQLNMAGLSEEDHQLGELILGSISDDGYLTGTIEALAESTNCDIERLKDVLLIVQDFHPTGIAARDLQECLMLQLVRAGDAESLAGLIVGDHLEKLGGRKYPEIAKALKVPVDDVHEAVKVITKLDPKPGRLYANDVATYIMPEIAVQKVNGDYVVILNDEQLPHVRISRHYRRLLSDPSTTAEVKTYVRERIRSGAFLIKSIHQRQKTITRIATEIVERQTEFLDHGITRLRPMTMAEVAEAVGVHETTVSRAVSAKYMRTPRGIFELKYFFTPGIKSSSGADLSNMTVKHMIKEMVDAEDSAKPLSDQELVARLQAQGIKIARRTIAKYRLILHIPPSHMRKGY